MWYCDWSLAAAVDHCGGGAVRWSANCVEVLIKATAEVHRMFESWWAETSAILLTSQWLRSDLNAYSLTLYSVQVGCGSSS
jgi:hypothetical protein